LEKLVLSESENLYGEQEMQQSVVGVQRVDHSVQAGQMHVTTEDPDLFFAESVGRRQQPSFESLLSTLGENAEIALWMVRDIESDLNLQAELLDATISRAPARGVHLDDYGYAWAAGWHIRHGRHCDEVLILVSDTEPGNVFLEINQHRVALGVSPLLDPAARSISPGALAELSNAFRERLLSTVMLAFEIVTSAPTILSIASAF
jgi:hypothetical protein